MIMCVHFDILEVVLIFYITTLDISVWHFIFL